jgi:hypothetical protein
MSVPFGLLKAPLNPKMEATFVAGMLLDRSKLEDAQSLIKV